MGLMAPRAHRSGAVGKPRGNSPYSWTSGLYGDGPYPLDGPAAQRLLARMRAAGRLYWSDIHTDAALEAGPDLTAVSRWQATPSGAQRYTRVREEAADNAEAGNFVILTVEPLHDVDLDRRRIGRLQPDLPDRYAAKPLAAPAIDTAEAAVVRHERQKANVRLPAEPAAPESREARTITPAPVLELSTGYLDPAAGDGTPRRRSRTSPGR